MIHFTPPPDIHLGGPFVINIHSFAFCVGALTAYLLTTKRLPEKLRIYVDNLTVWMTVAGILGARLLFALVNYQSIHSFTQIFAFWEGGLISYGGFLGAILAWIAYIKIHKLPMATMCHAMGPAALLGWGLGRLGCFLACNGEFGVYTDMPWGIVVGSDMPRHPTMLYLALAHSAAAILIMKYTAHKWRINAAALSLCSFGLIRAVLDYWRDYNPAWLYYGSLAISLLWLGLGLLMCKFLPYPKEDNTPKSSIENGTDNQTA
ncbi:MAG: prolipoprotein diacylglyceryl transferase [Candidatus Bruticola sp.]